MAWQRIQRALALVVLAATAPARAVDLKIFGDLSLRTTDAGAEERGFVLGALDLFANERLGDRTSALVELVVEHDGEKFIVDLERLAVSYEVADQSKVSLGRFHSPFGIWNRRYLHGTILQETATRPFFLEFEDGQAGILPMHVMGLALDGERHLGELPIEFQLVLANPSALSSEAGYNPSEENRPERDLNQLSQWGHGVQFVGRVATGAGNGSWSLGLFAVSSDIIESGERAAGALTEAGKPLFRETILGADLAARAGPFRLLAELYLIDHDDKIGASGTSSATAFYVQPTYELSERLALSLRWAELGFDAGNPFLSLLGVAGESRLTFATRFDIDELNRLVLELERADRESASDATTARLTWSFILP